MVRGLTWKYGRHDKQVVGRTNIAIERATSKAKIEVISRVWSSCLQSSQSWRKLDPRKGTQQVPRSWTRLPALPKARTQAMEPQAITVQCTSNMMQHMSWYARCDMQCVCVLREEKGWTRHQLGKPSMLLERWDDLGWSRYKDHWERMHNLQMASKTRMTQIYD